MVAFLLCLKEMGDFAESKDKSFHLPHKMEKDKVGDMSIKIQFNNEETWTKSLKYTLTNLKWLLAWVVRMEAEQVAGKYGKSLAHISSEKSVTLPTSMSAPTVNATHSINNPPSATNTTNNNNNININNNTPNPTQPAPQKSRLTLLFSRSGNTS